MSRSIAMLVAAAVVAMVCVLPGVGATWVVGGDGMAAAWGNKIITDELGERV